MPIVLTVCVSNFEGGNPGGGGLELLSRLTGRSRTLEIVLGADTFDADTAALYGCM
jgi:enoyl-CoA hydratase/carnithine racemase